MTILYKEKHCGERQKVSLRIQKYECGFTLPGASDAGILILSLDGRVLQTFFREKTSRNLMEAFNPGEPGNAFFVQISAGQFAARRLVLKF
jgi:hypothetical protein